MLSSMSSHQESASMYRRCVLGLPGPLALLATGHDKIVIVNFTAHVQACSLNFPINLCFLLLYLSAFL